MKKVIILFLYIVVYANTQLAAQNEVGRTTYNSMTFVYVDNSSFDEYEVLNQEMADNLTNLINSQSDNPKHFFYFLATNEEKRIKEEMDEKQLTGSSGFLNKYLSKYSRDADYFADKEVMRDHFVNYPVKVKQHLNVNYFLSSAAVNRLFTDIGNLPTPLLFPVELLQYIEFSSDVSLKLSVYVNKEIISKYSENQIRDAFTFSNKYLNHFKYDIYIKPL